jgi:hypothetical protein
MLRPLIAENVAAFKEYAKSRIVAHDTRRRIRCLERDLQTADRLRVELEQLKSKPLMLGPDEPEPTYRERVFAHA